MSPFHSYPFLARPHHDCQSSSLRYRPFRASTRHCCPTTPPQISPHRSNPKLPRLISPIHSTQHHDCLIAPHHASRIYPCRCCLTRTDLTVSRRNFPHLARPLHTSCLTISIPNLSIQADPFQCKPAQPNLTKQNLSWPRLPDHKTPHQTAPVLSVKLLDCLNIPHASRPRRTFANSCLTIHYPAPPKISGPFLDCHTGCDQASPNLCKFLPDLSRSVSYPISPVHCKLPAAPYPTLPITSVPRLPYLTGPNATVPDPTIPIRAGTAILHLT
jgi:hypothetical protein